MPQTFVDELERVVDEVSSWGIATIRHVVTTLSNDGRGYGQEKIDIEQKLVDYRKIRNDPDQWVFWVQQKSLEIQNTLVNSGVGQDTLSALDLTKIATGMMLFYSATMEKELAKRII